MAFNGNPEASTVRTVSTAGELAAVRSDSAVDRSEWTDERLMLAIAARDEAAFAVLYDRYADLAYSVALRVLADAQVAEDATQEIFVRLWMRPETFIPARGKFLSWFMSVVRNRAVDEFRSRGRRRRHESVTSFECDEFLRDLRTPDASDPAAAAQVHEAQGMVRFALTELPPQQRMALELAYFSGYTQEEIAVALHEPLGTVKTRIRLGMQKLRRALNDRV